MTDIFLRIVELSWQAGVLALAVMLARLALRRAPKWAVCLLWALVAVRLVLPFSLQSPVSLQAAQSPVTAVLYELPQTQEAAQKTGEVLSGTLAEPLMPLPPTEAVTAQPVPAPKPAMTVSLLAAIWLAGVVMMLTYMLVSYLGIYRRVCTAVRLEDNVYRCGSWGTPFVLGLLRPRIYVPEGMDDTALPQVLAHERCHIRRGDHLVKPLAFLLLALHWFNPVLWAAYVLLGRDMENACDERVLRGVDGAGRAAYSRALVACAVRQRPAAVCPLAFGEVAVQERVKNAMNGKKPAVWAAVLLAIAAVVIAVCFLTSPGRREPSADGAWDAETLYALRTPYVGDPSAVGRILNAVGLDKMGADSDWDFTMQLSTEQEPYGLTLLYTYDSESFLGYGPMWAQRMRAGGYLTMALIDNLEWVAWQENGTETGRVANDGAYDIAAARQSVDGLRQLIEQLEADITGGAVGGTRQVYYSPAAVTREDGVSARLADVTYQNNWLTGELLVTVPPELTERYEGEDGTMQREFLLYTQVDNGEKSAVGGGARVESGADGLTLYQPFDLGIQLSAEQGFTVRFWAGDMGPMTVEYTAAGAASKEITPWPSEMENDPVSIDPADYGIVYDAAHLPDWETCPLSYLCAYLLGSDGAYTEGAADTLAARYRQAPRTVQGYLDKLAAKYEGVDQRLMAAIRTADGETFRIEPTVDVRKSAAAALDDRLTETLTGYFLMRANAIANNATGTAYCVEKLRWDALSRAQAAVWPYVAADDLRAAHITVDVTEVRTLNDGGTRLVLEELTMLDYGTGSDRYGWGTTHRLEIHDDRADVPRVTWDAYDESDLGDGHVSQDQQTDISAAAMDMAITGPWTGLVTDTRTEQAGGTEYHLIRIAGRWFGGTVQELGTPAQVGDLVSVWNYAAAGGDFEPLWQQELLERGSGGKTTEVFRRGDGLAVQLTCVHETQEDSEPAVYTLLSSAELSVLSLPSDVSYKLYGADGSIRATLTEGAVIPLTEQDGGIGAEHAYVLRFLWLT
ncbi:MAG: M56 family metallopeptidase [Oscillospiraceae bacterium]